MTIITTFDEQAGHYFNSLMTTITTTPFHSHNKMSSICYTKGKEER